MIRFLHGGNMGLPRIMLWKIKKWELIDYIGKVLLPTEYDSLDYVTKDVVIVTKDSKYGAVDINNRLVLPFEYDDIRFDIEEWCATGY